MLRRLLFASGIVLGLAITAPGPAGAQDASELIVRLNRVENVTRQLSGQIETLQYENRQLKEQLRKFQEDVEFRFQESGGKGGAKKAAPAGNASPPPPPPSGTNPGKRGDAFDPSQNPGAPGAPQQFGSTVPTPPPANPPPNRHMAANAPPPVEPPARTETPPPPQPPVRSPDVDEAYGVDTTGDTGDYADTGDEPPQGQPVDLSPPTGLPPEPTPSTSIAATGTGSAKADFEAAYALIQGRQYEQAEMSLRQFLQSHPRDALVPKATFWLGESYLQRSRSREAAEQFLKVSTDYANSAVAPEAMMKLGASLNALGAKAQACATLAEVERKYPSATASVRQGVEREQKRARCAA